MLKFGMVTDIKKGYGKVHFIEDDFVSDWLPVLVRKSLTDKDSWPLEVNEHVACMMDEYCETGVILGAIYNDQDAPDGSESPGRFRKIFSDGTVLEYDKNSSKLTADVKGTVSVKASGKITIESTKIELKGDVTVSGTLAAASISTSGGGSINAAGGTISAQEVNVGAVALSTHKHGGVQTGGGSTGTPIP